MSERLPLFVDLAGRRVLLVGAGPVAAAKLGQLRAAGATARVVALDVCEEIARAGVPVERRAFEAADLDGVWLVVAAATPDTNRRVAAAAEGRQVFVNAVDDPANASAFLGGVVRRDGVTLAISTGGAAPGLTALLREGLDAVLPRDLGVWLEEARQQRAGWRREGVPVHERRPLLLEALTRLYERRPEGPRRGTSGAPRTSTGAPRISEAAQDTSAAKVESGHVSLVGAGPGDPGLLTRRAVARLRAADLVLYDALIDRRILKLARRAQRFFVGKRAGRHAMTQLTINSVMIRAARRGKRVVRLKGGDPFVFGRGGEEALALRSAAVSFDVVPGVTSAVAAPALAGIPVTHRGVSSAFLVVGGHDEEGFAAAVDKVAPGGVTLIVLMGAGRRAALAQRLLDRGWPRPTPAAIVVDASMPTQAVWRGTLDDLSAEPFEFENMGPATIVIGEVVALATAVGRGREKRERHGSR
jgi:uroporphyrin-III C-methyltransferase/precorrin-2 dehydrogenase/sirohydrochlorin ferrochelatase